MAMMADIKGMRVTEVGQLEAPKVPEVIQVPEVPEVDIRNDRSEAA